MGSRYGTIIMGPAGAGKTTFCSSLIQHLKSNRRSCFYVNLDPAAEEFAFEPDVDIKDLITAMDDAIDQMHQTAKTITLFEVRSFEPPMREMGELVVQAAKLTAEAVPLLRAVGKEATRLSALTEQVIRIEDRADELHDEGLKALFRAHAGSDPMAYIVGSAIYGHLEKVVDRFEDVANEIQGLVIDHA